jgi:adenine-specific DNA glycosylase
MPPSSTATSSACWPAFTPCRGYPGDAAPLRALWQHAEAHTPAGRPGDYAQAIMDLGATGVYPQPAAL